MVKFFDNIPDQKVKNGYQQTTNEGSSKQAQKAQRGKTNEIKIEENILEDDEDKALGQTPKEDKSLSYKSISPMESSDKQYYTAENIPDTAQEKPQFQINLHNVFKAESEHNAGQENHQDIKEEEGNAEEGYNENEAGDKDDNKLNTSQSPSVNQRINNSLSLIEEAECEDSLSLT